MLPVLALVGRPNVGKSTLFNQLTKKRDALVADFSGLTRDRQYGQGNVDEKAFIIIDTGGIGVEEDNIDELMVKQSLIAIDEADIVLFMVDAKSGLTPLDLDIAKKLREVNKPVYLLINKSDGIDEALACSEFYQLGFENMHAIAASHKRGISQFLDAIFKNSVTTITDTQDLNVNPDSINIAFIGKPNVGKSTLVNRIFGQERVLVFDSPGTTRDSIYIPFEREEQNYTLIDTAGVRRKGKISQVVEKFSVIKALQAIKHSNVCILVIDAREGVTEQDLHLIGFIVEQGKCLVIAVNKWDGLTVSHKERVKIELSRRLNFIQFVKLRFISALHGTGVGDLFKDINKAYQSATKKLSTPELTRILQDAVTSHQPPLVNGRRIKLRYAHAGGQNPPIIVIHGNQTQLVPDSYKRYLINCYIKVLKLEGTPVKIELKSSDNPYKGKKNTISPRQLKKRKRMIKHYKKKS
jgi:GTPase